MKDKNGREIKIGDVVRREAGENFQISIERMRVLRFIGDRNIETDHRTNGSLPAIYLASLCEVIK